MAAHCGQFLLLWADPTETPKITISGYIQSFKSIPMTVLPILDILRPKNYSRAQQQPLGLRSIQEAKLLSDDVSGASLRPGASVEGADVDSGMSQRSQNRPARPYIFIPGWWFQTFFLFSI